MAEYLAEQLEIADPSCLKDYGERDGTARTHAGEIQNAEGWRDFSEVISELTEWLDARAWTTGDDDYEHPTHLTGPAAAAYPPPANGFTNQSSLDHDED
ncbi:DUF4158 domain-containing protein [Saccharopolyspora shandongensis]|uniref:DUF4158 domain-containing protein n=1 Tax=Saccharopolyspora shandongensis TaxID=418495 RepID=UPI0033C17FB3